MGYELRRAMREALGPHIIGLQRAVALEIADDARDESRTSYTTLENLARWTGAKDVNVVRNALKRLAAAGWEFRVPLGVGKDGRTLYAVPGRRVTFKVPAFEGVAGATPMGAEGVAGARSEGAPAPSQGAGATPFSSSPQVPSSLSRAPDSDEPPGAPKGERENEAAPKKQTHTPDKPTTAQRVVRGSGVVPAEHEAAFIAWVVAKHQVRGPAFWRTAAPDIPELAEAWRADGGPARMSHAVSRPSRVALADTCDFHQQELPCLGCAADRLVDPNPDGRARAGFAAAQVSVLGGMIGTQKHERPGR